MWVLWIVAVIVLMVGLRLADTYKYDLLGALMVGTSVLFLFISLIIWPIHYYDVHAKIAEYHALKETVNQSRQDDISEFERVTLTNRIIENNTALARLKYWNETFMFDMYIPDEIMQLEPIR